MKLATGLLLATTLLIAGCQTAPTITRGSVEVAGEQARVKLVFTEQDRAIIRDYYLAGKKHKKIPPGLAKKQTLPPGLRKHLVRHGTLPPGLRGRVLPIELERRLHRLPKGYARLIIGTDIVLIDERTRVILDVYSDIPL